MRERKSERGREIGIGVTEAGLLNSWPAAAHTHTLRHINMKDDRRQRSVVVASSSGRSLAPHCLQPLLQFLVVLWSLGNFSLARFTRICVK